MAVECTANNLAELAKCFTGLSPAQQQAIATYLLCQIANNGGGAAQTPWTSDIDGAGFSLSNVANVSATTFNGVKVYRALLSQAGTAAPTAVVLENSVGAIVWTRNNVGDYYGTLAGAFLVNKVHTSAPALDLANIMNVEQFSYAGRLDNNTIQVTVLDGVFAPTDEFNNLAICFMVYP